MKPTRGRRLFATALIGAAAVSGTALPGITSDDFAEVKRVFDGIEALEGGNDGWNTIVPLDAPEFGFDVCAINGDGTDHGWSQHYT